MIAIWGAASLAWLALSTGAWFLLALADEDLNSGTWDRNGPSTARSIVLLIEAALAGAGPVALALWALL